MKKLISFVAIAAMTAFVVSCGNDAAEKQRIADSTAHADSTAVANAQASEDHLRDSIKMDSANRALTEKSRLDSLRLDSMEKASKKTPRSKTKEEKQIEQDKKATQGRG
ncbi:MAG TPA: hypothetical protein VI731_09515 [Bacteroidia bacterium]|nr:hypothetical protein [Bacteroidia bacterium]